VPPPKIGGQHQQQSGAGERIVKCRRANKQ
jgi:hypothetical protein